jgi:hypothetical protein
MMRMAEFLEQIEYREAWLALEALDSGELPPYLGSTLRGALGHLLRFALCDGQGCEQGCQRPESCRYYSLFEQSRTPDGQNAPKPLILVAPANAELDAIALGGPVNLPYRRAAPMNGECVPMLYNEYSLRIQPGAVLQAGLRVVGPTSVTLPGILEALGRQGLDLGGVPFALRSAYDGTGRLLFDRRFPSIRAQMPALMRILPEPERAKRIRIVFHTPAMLKIGRKPSFDPVDFASRFLGHSLAQARKAHDWLMGRPCLPWIEAPSPPRIIGHRLFRYCLPRRSYRQGKWLDFDGVVGYLDLEGDFSAAMPYARSAEILHFGQKATFGLGKVSVLVLE